MYPTPRVTTSGQHETNTECQEYLIYGIGKQNVVFAIIFLENHYHSLVELLNMHKRVIFLESCSVILFLA